jgi:hypothetical protein
MLDQKSLTPLKAAAIGALAGGLTFFALGAVTAQTVLSVAQVRSNPKAYVGNGTVQVTGLAYGIRSDSRKLNNQAVPYIKLNLYEQDSKGNKGSHYVYVAIPASQFASVPAEGQLATITGPLKWPYEIAAIDP